MNLNLEELLQQLDQQTKELDRLKKENEKKEMMMLHKGKNHEKRRTRKEKKEAKLKAIIDDWDDLADDMENWIRTSGMLDENVNYFYIPIEFKLEDDGVRFTDIDLQKKVDKELKKSIKKYNLKVTKLTGSVEDRIKQIQNSKTEKQELKTMIKRELKTVKVDDLIPYEANPRRNNKSAKIVAKSIEAYGHMVISTLFWLQIKILSLLDILVLKHLKF